MTKRSIEQADVQGKRVLLRLDLNVPMSDGRITDESRIVAALPTIRYLVDHGAKLIVASHLGRPKGKPVESMRLAPVADRLSELIDRRVQTVTQVVGPDVERAIEQLKPGEVLLLENVRFEPGEEANDHDLAAQLAGLADLYVNDAFGAAHRAHASTEGVAHLLPAYAGFLLLHELEALSSLTTNPQRPFLALLGGAKVSDKLGVIKNLLSLVDCLALGGGMANTFLLAQGYPVGRSLVEEDRADNAKRLIDQASGRGVELLLPTDVIVAASLDADAADVVAVENVLPDTAIYDIGPATVARYREAVERAKTIFWNGPLGVFEREPFSHGTRAIAEAVAAADAWTVVGGGDSLAAIEQLGLGDRIDHRSTGGGASLELLEGKTLPGVAVIPDAVG